MEISLLTKIAAATHNLVPFFILLNFVLLIGLIWFNRGYFKKNFSEIKKTVWWSLFFIVCFALFLRLAIPMLHHRIYMDEAWYLEAGKNMLQTGLQGNYFKSIGWPFVVGILYGFFGVNNWVALYANVFIGALTAAAVFFLARALLRRDDLGLLSALIFSLMAPGVFWSASAETNISAVFFMVLALYLCFLYFKERRASLFWLSIVALAFVAQFRPESGALLALFIFGCFIFPGGEKYYFWRKGVSFDGRAALGFILSFLVFFILVFCNFSQVLDFQTSMNFVESDSGGAMQGSNWSLGNLISNTSNYGSEPFGLQGYIFNVLLLAGVIYLFMKKRPEAWFLLVWAAIFWLVHFTSWIQTRNFWGRTRYFLVFYPIFAIFFSGGIIYLKELLEKKVKKPALVKVALAILIVFAILPSGKTLYATGILDRTASELILETKIPELSEKDIPANCAILAYEPKVFTSSTNFKTFRLDEYLRNNRSVGSLDKIDCLLFFEDLYCFHGNAFDSQDKCKKVTAGLKNSVFKVYSYGPAEYTFYRMK